MRALAGRMKPSARIDGACGEVLPPSCPDSPSLASGLSCTYVLSWLVGPGFVGGLLSQADQIVFTSPDDLGSTVIGLVVVFVGWLIGSIVALAALLTGYQQQWAPVREVRWLDRSPGRAAPGTGHQPM